MPLERASGAGCAKSPRNRKYRDLAAFPQALINASINLRKLLYKQYQRRTEMTTKEADYTIAAARPITVHSKHFDETFVALFIRRDRRMIYTESGVFDRSDLEIVSTC